MSFRPDSFGVLTGSTGSGSTGSGSTGAGSTGAGSAPQKTDADLLFDALLEILRGKMSGFVMRGWLDPLCAAELHDDTIELCAPTSFHRDWVRDHYLEELHDAAKSLCGVALNIKLGVDAARCQAQADRGDAHLDAELVPPVKVRPASVSTSRVSTSKVVSLADRRPKTKGRPLSPAYNFDSYITGQSNEVAYAASRAVADEPGALYSPLFLFGGTGLGKTHLLHAIGHAALAQNPDLRVVYMSAEEWVNEYITEIRRQKFDDFRARYRNGCDLLLIDDIQFLAGKDASQDEFFHTFNSLHELGRQIVVTSDRYPHEIEGLEDRLKTRLGWGLIADIKPPELETRVAILQRKALSLGTDLPLDVGHYLASHIHTSVRELEGALVRLCAYARLTQAVLTLSLAKEHLRPVLKGRAPALTTESILKVVATYFDLRVSDLRGKSRQRQVTRARQTAMYLVRKHLECSLPEIGRAFGGRDHTTVLSSVRKIERLRKSDAGVSAVIGRLESTLL
ncbi:MAG: chromosomal replication initiator protein DnaA [Deltaproteobacteria bacterium]|nr:chromosomal replication initiator protein DnaA [Deltaproteobacteria bacterium]